MHSLLLEYQILLATLLAIFGVFSSSTYRDIALVLAIFRSNILGSTAMHV